MRVKIKVVQEVDAVILEVQAGVRYWEDTRVNGESDDNGDLIPCRLGDIWNPFIDIDKGIITNWKKGVNAIIHYKVCDDGDYIVFDGDGEAIKEFGGCYVPKILSPAGNGYGDYIYMLVDESGKIKDWNASLVDNLINYDDDDEEY